MSTILTDDFNSYNDGDLNGQGDWSGDTGFDIQGDVTFEGAKAVKYVNPASEVNIVKTGSLSANGKYTFYMKNSINTSNITVQCREGAQTITPVGFIGSISAGWAGIYAGGGWTNIGTFTANVWSYIEVEWHDDPSNQIRARIDGGTWSTWAAPMINWSSGIDTLKVTVDPAGAGSFTAYWDYIAEDPYTPTTFIPTIMNII
ncbi:MAG: hypothetical protein ACTSQA_03580 [Candidatus Heimdallarchaeaceae archaeon]